MSSIYYGKKLNISVFGESHGPAIGCVVDGLPPGVKLDYDLIEKNMSERRHGVPLYTTNAEGEIVNLTPRLVTARKEPDVVEVLSGLNPDGTVQGSPLAVLIRNRDVRRNDYKALGTTFRPGHADYVSYVKFGGFADLSGGGHFSGRITAPLVYAGSIVEPLLREKGIAVTVEMERIGGVNVREHTKIAEFVEELLEQNDSAGAVLSVQITGLPVGIGNPMFDSLESQISRLMFSIPGVKGIEFGSGFSMADGTGSVYSDALESAQSGNMKKNFAETPNITKISPNHNGGINGGLSNGLPLFFRLAVKPTSSYYKIKESSAECAANPSNQVLNLRRHDKCFALRIPPIVRSLVAILIYNEI